MEMLSGLISFINQQKIFVLNYKILIYQYDFRQLNMYINQNRSAYLQLKKYIVFWGVFQKQTFHSY